MRDLIQNEDELRVRDIELLKVGRHFRIAYGIKAIVGRNKTENQRLLQMAERSQDVIIYVSGFKGPLTLVPRGVKADRNHLITAAQICVRYSDAPPSEEVEVILSRIGGKETVKARSADEELLSSLRVTPN